MGCGTREAAPDHKQEAALEQDHQDRARSAPGQRQDTIEEQHWNRINTSAPELSNQDGARSAPGNGKQLWNTGSATGTKTHHMISAPGISTGWSPTRNPLETFQGSIQVVTGCYVSLQTNHVVTDKR